MSQRDEKIVNKKFPGWQEKYSKNNGKVPSTFKQIAELNSESNARKVKLKTANAVQASKQSGSKQLDISNIKESSKQKSQAQLNKRSTSTEPIKVKNSSIKTTVIKDKRNQNVTSGQAKKRPALQTSSNKPNLVLDTYHNVTVSSPPPKIKQFKVPLVDTSDNDNDNRNNNEINKINNLQENTIREKRRQSQDDNINQKRCEIETIHVEQQHNKVCAIKEPISFEINFDHEKHLSKIQQQETGNDNDESRIRTPESDINDNHYSDDFDSYESDFESASSSTSTTEATSGASLPENCNIKLDNENCNKENNSKQMSVDKDKNKENKLDSGNYEICGIKEKLLNVKNHEALLCDSQQSQQLKQSQQLCDSLEGSNSLTFEHFELDSGISGYGNHTSTEFTKPYAESLTDTANCVGIFYEGYTKFFEKPFRNDRSVHLLEKIQFDSLGCILLDMKPMSYEMFMQIYGNIYSRQEATQTLKDANEGEVQTDVISQVTRWTQNPCLYDSHCCGDIIEDNINDVTNECQFSLSLKMLNDLKESENSIDCGIDSKGKSTIVQLNKLEEFLRRATVSVMQSITLNQQDEDILQSTNLDNMLTISKGYCYLNTNFIEDLNVTQVYSNSHYDLIVTIHEFVSDIKHAHVECVNILMVWSCNDFQKPMHVLRTWSEVSYTEISNASPNIIVSGLRDGNIALWDLNDWFTNSIGSSIRLIGCLRTLAPSQTITPIFKARKQDSNKDHCLMDLGACIDIKSFQYDTMKFIQCDDEYNHQDYQFVSLHENGILTVWSLIKNGDKRNVIVPPVDTMAASKTKRYDNEEFGSLEELSSWANYKLIQTAIINLKDYFIKTIVKRKEAKQSIIQMNCLDTSIESIYVCTNQDFILICTKTLKADRFKRILIPDGYCSMCPIYIKLLKNDDFLAVGFPNSALLILNCESYMNIETIKDHNRDLKTNDRRKMGSKKSPNIEQIIDDIPDGKSCTIQNIILNERRPSNTAAIYFERDCSIRNMMTSRITSSSWSDEYKRQPNEININDHQLILTSLLGQPYTANPSQKCSYMNVLYDGWRLYAIMNHTLRVYDLHLQTELQLIPIQNDLQTSSSSSSSAGKLLNGTLAKSTSEKNCLILFKENNFVEVHKLRK